MYNEAKPPSPLHQYCALQLVMLGADLIWRQTFLNIFKQTETKRDMSEEN